MLTATRTADFVPRRLVVVGISDCGFSADPEASLITYALGSCIAVAVYDPARKAGALLHIILPESQLNPEKARQNPWMFADTGIPKLFERFASMGGDRRRAIVRLAGGSQVMDQNGVFNIGKRNHLAVKKMLWQVGVLIQAEAVGGEVSRTVRLELDRGGFYVREGGREEFELRQGANAHSRVSAPGNGVSK